MKAHNCIKWLEEGRGCSICSKIAVLSKEEIIEIQNKINWKISSLEEENKKLKKQINTLRNQQVAYKF